MPDAGTIAGFATVVDSLVEAVERADTASLCEILNFSELFKVFIQVFNVLWVATVILSISLFNISCSSNCLTNEVYAVSAPTLSVSIILTQSLSSRIVLNLSPTNPYKSADLLVKLVFTTDGDPTIE